MAIITILVLLMAKMERKPESVSHPVHEVHPPNFIRIQQVPRPGGDILMIYNFWYFDDIQLADF